MKALVTRDQDQYAIEEVTIDPPKAGELKLKMGATGVCHSDLSMDGKTIKGSYYGDTNFKADFPKLLGLYQCGKLNLDDMVTRTYTIDEAPQAFIDMRKGLNARGVIVYD